MNFDKACDVIFMVSNSIDQAVSLNKCFIIYHSKKLCRMSQHCKGSGTENACIATSKYIKVTT